VKKTRRLLPGTLIAIPALLVLGLSAASGSTPVPKAIHVRPMGQWIAMDGPRIVYDGFARVGCNRIFVLNVRTGVQIPLRRCLSDFGSRQVAIAGRRIAWINTECGNSECDDYLSVASLPRPKARLLASAHSEGEVGAEQLEGAFIGPLVGSGALLAVNRWSGAVNGEMITFTKAGLDLVGARGLRRFVAGRKATFAQATDAGRVAVLRGDNSVGIYDASGRLLRELAPSSVAEGEEFGGNAVALQGDYLVVLTNMQTLEIYNAHSGTMLRRWAVPKDVTNLDVHAGVVAYAEVPGGRAAGSGSAYKVHVLRIATGKDVVVGRGRFQLLRNVEIEAPGLVYVKDTRNVAFMPLKRILAALS
jgi:hypothetical protein